VCPKDCEQNVRFRDDAEGANVWMMDDADGTSAHNVQDEGEGCESAESIISRRQDMNRGGEVKLVIPKLSRYYMYMSVQTFDNICNKEFER
jgi:hypothetical protein